MPCYIVYHNIIILGHNSFLMTTLSVAPFSRQSPGTQLSLTPRKTSRGAVDGGAGTRKFKDLFPQPPEAAQGTGKARLIPVGGGTWCQLLHGLPTGNAGAKFFPRHLLPVDTVHANPGSTMHGYSRETAPTPSQDSRSPDHVKPSAAIARSR